jgi:hypothetical protein
MSFRASSASLRPTLVTLSPPPPQLVAKAAPAAVALPAADRRETVVPQAAPAVPAKALLVSSPPAAPKLALN